VFLDIDQLPIDRMVKMGVFDKYVEYPSINLCP
jgi:hypothetical protein